MAKNNITLTVELCDADRARLDALLAAVQNIGTPYNAPVPETPAQDAAEAAQSVTHADVQRRVVELSAAGQKAQVREIVKKFAPKVSAIPADDLADVWTLLDALGQHMEANR